MPKSLLTFNMRVYEDSHFGKLNVFILEDSIWFIGREVAEKLDYKNYRKALYDNVESEDKRVITKSEISNVTVGVTLDKIPNRGLTCINESGFYSLVLGSKLPTAREFKHWVTSEIIPSIRKHGAYMTKEVIEQTLLNPDFIIKLATELKEEQEKNARLTEEKKYLETENAALTGEINLWSERSVINALVRKYSSVTRKSFEYGFRTYYRYLNTKLHINLKSRKTRSGKKNAKYFDFLKVNELKPAIGVAVAMCKEVGIDVVAVINAENAKQYL